MAAQTVPNSYSDPYWTQLAANAEQRYGLPAGSLQAVLTHGERSNNDQVSEAGARTPFQITPATRDAILKKNGIDAYLGDGQNAADAAALVLKDGYNFAKQHSDDPEAQGRLAAGFYHAGGDQANWGPKTHAYIARVSDGARAARLDALSNDFAAFMKANPAVLAASPATAPAPTAQDALSSDFAAWRSTQAPAPDLSGVSPPAAPAGPGLVDQATGGGEAGLAAITSPFAYLATLGGGALQAGKEALYGLSGDPNFRRDLPGAFDRIADAAARTGAHFQYVPQTDLGQQYAGALGETLQPLMGLNPLEASLIGGGVAPAAGIVGDSARAAPGAVSDGAAAAAAAIREQIGRVTGEQPAAGPTPGSMGSAGAAGTDIALQRQATAATLPVPIRITKGQATRDFADQQFEGEAAKRPDAVGDALRENTAQQNKQLGQNFDAMIDRTGAQQASDLEAGRFIVDDALKSAAQREKAVVRQKYDAARAAGELEAPVSLQGVIDHLNESRPEETTAPLLTTVRNLVQKLGIAKEEDGKLVALPPKGAEAPAAPPARSSVFGEQPKPPAAEPGATLDIAEQLRQAINRNVDYEATNQRQATILKGLIDDATDGKGGGLYQEARRARARYAQLFENNQIVSDLLGTKPGTADRRVALDDVTNHVILGGSREDLSNFRRTLDVSDQHAGITPGTDGPGRQAWREVQAATLRYIADQAGVTGKNAARDTHGNPIVSYAGLNTALRTLDQNGKLDFILGKKDAQTVRDIAEVASVIKTVPPGAVNTSNTAATLLAALAETGAMAAFTGLPAPLVTIAKFLKDRRDTNTLRLRVDQALQGLQKPAAPPMLAPSPGTF